MPNPVFVEKLLKHLDQVDKEAIQNYLIRLQKEKEISESLLGELPVGILLLDKKNDIIWANNSSRNILGSRIPEDQKVPIDDAINDSGFRLWLQDELDKKDGIYAEEKEILFPQPRYLIVSIRPLELNAEFPASSLIVLIDITSIKTRGRQESELQRIAALIKLAKGIAHELGNPLNSIAIHLRLLDRMCETLPAKDKKKFQDTIQVLTDETARLDRIIKNFLKATRQKPPQFKLGHIQDALEESLRFFSPSFKEHKIKLKTDFADDLPEFLFDRDKLYQAFTNIIKNAVEAMPKGGTLTVKSAFRDKICTVLFQDTGNGIPESDLPYLFEEYYSTKEEGSGLGLAIVYNIIREHGGRIEVKSDVGKGTAFIFYLPIRKEKLQLPMSKKWSD